jgi:hypothetical protein
MTTPELFWTLLMMMTTQTTSMPVTLMYVHEVHGIVLDCITAWFIVHLCRGTIDPMHTLRHKVHNMFAPGLIITLLFAIFTIGPLRNTISDFWRMIWQYKLRTVIMLTETVEAGRVNTLLISYSCYYTSPLSSPPPPPPIMSECQLFKAQI